MEVEGAAEAKEEEGAEAGDEMDADLFQVEEILARRLQPDSEEVAEYLVRWKGYSEVSLTLRTLTLTLGDNPKPSPDARGNANPNPDARS